MLENSGQVSRRPSPPPWTLRRVGEATLGTDSARHQLVTRALPAGLTIGTLMVVVVLMVQAILEDPGRIGQDFRFYATPGSAGWRGGSCTFRGSSRASTNSH